jgi:hypothetical protein
LLARNRWRIEVRRYDDSFKGAYPASAGWPRYNNESRAGAASCGPTRKTTGGSSTGDISEYRIAAEGIRDQLGTLCARVGGLFVREQQLMRDLSGNFAAMVLAVALVGPVFIAACEGEVRTYGVGYGDYDTWNHHEVVYYNNWEHETHRDHVDFAKRSDAEQKEYYSWQHSQGGHPGGH